MLHQLYLSAKSNTVARLDAQANKKPKVSKVGATQYKIKNGNIGLHQL